MSYRISRRAMLMGLGASIPLPHLNIMAAQKSEPATDMRFVGIFKPNGVYPPAWEINGGTDTEYELSGIQKPLEGHKKDLLIISNMGNSGFSSHEAASARFLSATDVGGNRGMSMDQVIAHKIGGNSPVRSLELTTEGIFAAKPECSFISYDEKGRPIPRQKDPQSVFNQLFNNPMQTVAGRREMASILDTVMDDISAVLRKTGSEDKVVLDEYLTTLRETEARIQQLKDSESVPAYAAGKLPSAPEIPENLDERTMLLMDLIAMALWTDSTRCATLMMGNSNSRHHFDFLGVNDEHHRLTHFLRNFSELNVENLMKINLWHSEKFAYFLDLLKNYQDKGGPIYDKTLVLYGSGMGHSDSHSAYRIPTVLSGGACGRIQTGRHIFPENETPLSSLHLTLLQKLGIEASSFGGSDQIVSGLSDSNYQRYQEAVYTSWQKSSGSKIEAQGRLRLSSEITEANIYYLDLNDANPIRIEVGFKETSKFEMPYHCGKVVTISGTVGSDENGPAVRSLSALQKAE